MAVNRDNDLRNFKCFTFHVLLKEVGFKFRKQGNKALLIKRRDIIVECHYFHKMKRFRAQGRNITLSKLGSMYHTHTVLKEWKDKFIITPKDAVTCGLPQQEVQGLFYCMWVVKRGAVFLPKKFSGLPFRDR